MTDAGHPPPRVVDLARVLADVAEHWSPRTVAVVNDYDVRVAKVLGEFARHSHPDTDEFFQVLAGELVIRLDDTEVRLGPGQSYVVPRGVPHQPVAEVETQILMFEPSATVNTGDAPGSMTQPRRVV